MPTVAAACCARDNPHDRSSQGASGSSRETEYHHRRHTPRAGSAALATFWARGAPVNTSALVPGIDPSDDRQALEGLQSLILCLCGDCPAEPGFDLLTIPDRPLLATVPIPAAPSPDMGTIAEAETCLAAAFFLHVIGGD